MRHTATGHGGHRSMVRTVVCGAADEGSIPSGHPTQTLAAPAAPRAPSRPLMSTRFLRAFSSTSQEALIGAPHSDLNRQKTCIQRRVS